MSTVLTRAFLSDLTAAAVAGIAEAIHAADHPAPTYPQNHAAGMAVPKGGSSCASCKYLADNKTDCTEENFQKWNGSEVIPGKIDEYCSDWYVPRDGISAAEEGWHAVDWDATLVKYNGFKGDTKFGAFLDKSETVQQVRDWLKKGEIVKIFTARADKPASVKAIKKICLKHFGQELEVTNIKDHLMIDSLDDRNRVVRKNTGEIIAYGTSEGVRKAWDTRGRGLALGDIPPKDKSLVMVFGGSFNPPHVGHYESLERARSLLQEEGYNVDKVVVAPTAPKLLQTKLGSGAYPLEDRVAMSKLTFTGPDIHVTGAPAQEAETMEGKLRRTQLADWAAREYPGRTVVNVTGEDQAPGHPPGFPSLYSGDKGSNHEGYYYLALDRPPGGLSSTKIREAIKQNQSPPGMTPAAAEYLHLHIKASSETADQRGTLWNGIQIIGFTGPEEEGLRAMLSRVPPELLVYVKVIESAKELNAKHGRYLPDEQKIMFNPTNFQLRQRFGTGDNWIWHQELTAVHEIGHSLWEHLTPEEKASWHTISGWMEGTKSGQAPPYVETRPGWEHKISKYTHKAGAKFPRYYAEKNPNEDFSDCFGFFMLNKAHQIGPAKRAFFEQYIKDHVKRYPQVSIQSPIRAYGTSEGVTKAWDTRGRGRHGALGTGRTPGRATGTEGQYSRRSVIGRLYRRLLNRTSPESLDQIRRDYGKGPANQNIVRLDRHGLRSGRWRITISGDNVRMVSNPAGTVFPNRPPTMRGDPSATVTTTPEGQAMRTPSGLTPSEQTQYPNLARALEQRRQTPPTPPDVTRVGLPTRPIGPSISLPSQPERVIPASPPNPSYRKSVDSLAQASSAHQSFENLSSKVDITRSQLETFQREFKMSPDTYRNTLLKGLSPEVAEHVDVSFARNPIRPIWQIKAEGAGMDVSRSFDLEAKTVYHSLFTLSGSMQGQGIAKHIFDNSLDIYDHMGIKSVGVSASLSNGGYAWARFGFVPTQSYWDSIAREVKSEARYSSVTPDIKAQVNLITEMKDPRAIWLLAGLKDAAGKSVGAKFLRGKDWGGKLDLNNEEQYKIVRDYAKRYEKPRN